jgi:DNA-binding transcriptional LysR family regulator
VIVRNFEYLIALGREMHFARAAEACRVSQPTLSAGIRQLEEDMGVLLVKRGSRLQGFTPEGARVLEMALRMQADCERLKRDLQLLRNEFTGRLAIATTPALMPMLAAISVPFSERHVGAEMHLRSLDDDALHLALHRNEIDLAVTDLPAEAPTGLQAYPLYRERYLLLAPEQQAVTRLRTVSWDEVKSLPLCVLSAAAQPLAQHRAHTGVPLMQCDSLDMLTSHLRTGRWSTVIPQSLAASLESLAGMRAIPLQKPHNGETVGFLVRDTTPLAPLVHAFLEIPHDAVLVPLLRKRLAAHKRFAAGL